jgi:hypothetical protein
MKVKLFLQGEIITRVKNTMNLLKIFFSRTSGTISIKLITQHPRMKGI